MLNNLYEFTVDDDVWYGSSQVFITSVLNPSFVGVIVRFLSMNNGCASDICTLVEFLYALVSALLILGRNAEVVCVALICPLYNSCFNE